MLYLITFTDNSVFEGGDTIENSGWSKILDKPIAKLEYFIGDGSSLVLRNFESYAAITEAQKTIIKKVGNCPKCNAIGKISQAIIKHGDGRTSKKLIARCSECKWTGKITELKDLCNYNGNKYKYIMGLKEGIVTSYRISLSGTNGKDKYQLGDITKREYPKGKEYHGKEAVADFAWKKGIK